MIKVTLVLVLLCCCLNAHAFLNALSGGTGLPMTGMSSGLGMMSMPSLALLGRGGGGGSKSMKQFLKMYTLMSMLKPSGKGGMGGKSNFLKNMIQTQNLCEINPEGAGGEGISMLMGGCKFNPFQCMTMSMERYNVPHALQCSPMGLCCFKGFRDKYIAKRLFN